MSKIASIVPFLSRLWDFHKELGPSFKTVESTSFRSLVGHQETKVPDIESTKTTVSLPFFQLQTETCLPCRLRRNEKQRDEQ